MTVKILADSACDLSEHYYNELNIEMVPLTVHFNGEDLKDNIDISPKTIYDAMREGKFAKTSQVSPQTFKTIFTSYAETNQPLVYLAFSSGLSGTYQTAKMMETEVKEAHPEAPIYVIDTKCASVGYGLIVLHAAEMANRGATADEIIASATDRSAHMEHIFTVDDLAYLQRGGRISKSAAFIGGLLKIKPLLHVENGELVPLEKIRGSKKVLNRMLELMEERGADLENQVIGLCHGDDPERIERLAAMIKEKFGVKDILTEMVGSVIGAHSGPGTLAVFFLNKTD